MKRVLAFALPLWRRGNDRWDNARRSSGGNPLMKGLVVLLMAAAASTLLVVTADSDPYALEAVVGSEVAEDPAAPGIADRTTDSSVLGVAGEVGRSDEAEAAALAEVGGAGVVNYADAIVRARLNEQPKPQTTTTAAAPTTTAAPTTRPPTTEAPTTEAAPTSVATTTVDADASTAAEESTITAAPVAEGGSDSTETTTPADTAVETVPTTAAPTTTAPPAGDPGWVDSGNGVLLPPVLIAIRFCESTDNYQAANRYSSARGAYQFLTGSWAAYGHKDRYGVAQAHLATNAQQDEAALITWQRDGTRPWNASRSCWSSRI